MMSPHPDDERLSAWIDGEEPDLGGHETCAHCMARVDRLRHVARAVAERPAGLGRAEAEAMVVRAVDAVAAGTPDDVLAFRRARPGVAAVRRPRAMLGLAAAAAVVVALAAVPLLGGRGDDPTTTSLAAAPVVDGGDLGEQADPRALADEVRPDLGLPPIGAANSLAAPAAPAPGDATAGRAATADAQTATDSAAGGATGTEESAKSTATTRRQRRPARSSTTCLAQAMSQGGPGLGDVVYRATLRWQGTPAEALAFRSAVAPDGPKSLTVRLFVMSLTPQNRCQILVAQSFAA
jgi:hypothetical protein